MDFLLFFYAFFRPVSSEPIDIPLEMWYAIRVINKDVSYPTTPLSRPLISLNCTKFLPFKRSNSAKEPIDKWQKLYYNDAHSFTALKR